MIRRARVLATVVATVPTTMGGCETWARTGDDAITPPTNPSPVLDADEPDPMPNQVNEATFISPPDESRPDPDSGGSFIVPPRDPDRPPAAECAIEREQNQYFCTDRETAARFDDGDGKLRLGCAAHIIAVGPDRSLRGLPGFPACALGRLEPCETHHRRNAHRGDQVCCYAIACPTEHPG